MQIRTTEGQRLKLTDALTKSNAARNEVIWSYLVADVLVRNPSLGLSSLFGVEMAASELWFESQPLALRDLEGNTRIDLAAGAIRQRTETANGIEFDPNATRSWVGFVEAKVLSDCSVDVTHDHTRNQLTRVIENALCFQSAGALPERITFALLTPRFFKNPRHSRSRLYGYKFAEYSASSEAILDDIELCELQRRTRGAWTYPELRGRLDRLQLHWAAYEDIFALDPELSEINVVRCAISGSLPTIVLDRINRSISSTRC